MGRKWWIIVELMDFGKFSSVECMRDGGGEKKYQTESERGKMEVVRCLCKVMNVFPLRIVGRKSLNGVSLQL